jgi:uncharacterized protein YprB with RNaseH-like and TPR domain
MERPRKRWISQVPEDINKRENSWQEIGNERLWEYRRDWRLFAHRPALTETISKEAESTTVNEQFSWNASCHRAEPTVPLNTVWETLLCGSVLTHA